MFRVGEKMLGLQAHPEFGPDYVEALLDAPVKAGVAEKAHYFARTLGVSAGLEALPSTFGRSFVIMLDCLDKMLKKHPEIPAEEADAQAETAFLALYIAHRASQREVLLRGRQS